MIENGHQATDWMQTAAVRTAALTYGGSICLRCGRLALITAGLSYGVPIESVEQAVDLFLQRLAALALDGIEFDEVEQ